MIRYRLSLVLASTILQLFKTPWLSERWRLDDIHLVAQTDHPFTASDLYVTKCFPPRTLPSSVPQPQSRSWVQNELVFALGVALIELSFGQPLHACKTKEDVDDYGKDTIFTEFSIATRLVQEVGNREALKYTDAARRCIFFKFDASSNDLDDPTLQEQFYKSVVVPLQELCDMLQ